MDLVGACNDYLCLVRCDVLHIPGEDSTFRGFVNHQRSVLQVFDGPMWGVLDLSDIGVGDLGEVLREKEFIGSSRSIFLDYWFVNR